MASRRKARVTGLFSERGEWFYRLSASTGKVGPFATWSEAEGDYLKAKQQRLLSSPKARGNAKFTRF